MVSPARRFREGIQRNESAVLTALLSVHEVEEWSVSQMLIQQELPGCQFAFALFFFPARTVAGFENGGPTSRDAFLASS